MLTQIIPTATGSPGEISVSEDYAGVYRGWGIRPGLPLKPVIPHLTAGGCQRRRQWPQPGGTHTPQGICVPPGDHVEQGDHAVLVGCSLCPWDAPQPGAAPDTRVVFPEAVPSERKVGCETGCGSTVQLLHTHRFLFKSKSGHASVTQGWPFCMQIVSRGS